MRLTSYLAPGYPPALFEVVAEVLGVDLALEVGRSGPDPRHDPFAAARSDLGWVCSTSYVELMAAAAPSVQLAGIAWVPTDRESGGAPVYYSDVVVDPDSELGRTAADVDDLVGARVACNDPASLSGYHALRIELARRGRDPASFASLVMTGGHHHSIDRLLAGDVDAAVIDSIVLGRRAATWPEVARLRIVSRLGPWPTQPLVVREGIAPEQIADWRSALLAANDDPDARTVFAASGIDRLVEVSASDYVGVFEAMAALDSGETASGAA